LRFDIFVPSGECPDHDTSLSIATGKLVLRT